MKERIIKNLAAKIFSELDNVKSLDIVRKALRFNMSARDIAILAYLLCSFLLASLLGSILLHPLRIGHDQAMHFEMGRLLLHGYIPYIDMLDSNPPLIYYLDTIPALFSNYCRMPPPLAFNLFVWAVAVFSLWASGGILLTDKHRFHFFYLAPLLVALTSLNSVLSVDFGQREHLFVLLYAPFFFLRWFRHQGEHFGPYRSILIGIIGGIGICLKHYFVVIAAAVEIYWLIQGRRLKPFFTPEVLAAVAVALIYLIHFLFAPAAMRAAYFSFIVPLYTYGYIFWDGTDIFILNCYGVRELQLMLALVLVAQLMPRRFSLLPPLVVLTLSALCIFDYQGKGWTYQSIPVTFGMFLLMAVTASLALSYLSSKIRLRRTVLISVLLTFACAKPILSYCADLYSTLQTSRFNLAQIGYKGSCTDTDLGPYARTIVEFTKPSDTVLFIGNGVFPAFPAILQSNRAPASRHLNAIILSLFETVSIQPPSAERTRLLKYEAGVIEQYSQDIDRNKPRLIFVEQRPVWRYLEPYKFKETAMRDYEYLKTVEDFDVFRRVDGSQE